ncbi:hypothetical protein [Aeromonas sp. 604534]|uniref:hypothetical protein n=1 Tax=Aeromonas sp. 604534 TaxID=2712055 RepID=UPI003BA34BCB
MKHLDKLVNESIDVENGRDELIAVAKKTSSKIYKKLVNEQATALPVATVYGVKQKLDGKDPFISHVYNDVVATDLIPTASFMTGDKIKDESGIVAEVLTPFSSDNADMSSVYSLLIQGKVRVLNDLPLQAVVQESQLEISRWRANVGSKLVRFDASIEMLQDLDKQGVDSIELVYDVIGNVISESVNSEIILKLIALAKKDKEVNLINYETSYYRGRELISKIGELVGDIKKNNGKPSFVLCTPRVEAMLKASSQVTGNVIDGMDLEIVCDVKTPVDYMLVGCASENRLEPASLYYSPMVLDDGEMSLLFTREMLNMHPSYGCCIRYALTTIDLDSVDSDKVTEVDWTKHANKSPYTSLSRVIL